MNQREVERGHRGEYISHRWVEKTNMTEFTQESVYLKSINSLCVELEKMPLITFWNKFVRDDNSSIVVCISFNSLWRGANSD